MVVDPWILSVRLIMTTHVFWLPSWIWPTKKTWELATSIEKLKMILIITLTIVIPKTEGSLNLRRGVIL